MRAVQPAATAPLSSVARFARPALAGLLLLVVIAGVRTASPAVAGQGPWHGHVVLMAAILEVVLAGLLVAVWIVRRRRPGSGHPAALLRITLQRAIIFAMVATAVLAVISRLHLHPPPPQRRPQFRGPTPKRLNPAVRNQVAHEAADLTYVVYALVALLLLAAIVACVVLILRRKPTGLEGEVLAIGDDEGASLRQAIDSGRSALRALDDAQAAIIACYVAMEASLAKAGTARADAETPGELLARAVESGLLRGPAAGRLTVLFYEARFSSHALPETAKAEASRALDEISIELQLRPDSGSVSGGPPAIGARP